MIARCVTVVHEPPAALRWIQTEAGHPPVLVGFELEAEAAAATRIVHSRIDGVLVPDPADP